MRRENERRRNCEPRIADCGSEEKTARLFELFDLADHLVEIGPVTRIEFGMEQFAIGANFKGAAARRHEGKRFDAFAEFKNFGRQTDGLRRVVSNDAIFDRDFRFHPGALLSGKNGTEVRWNGQGGAGCAMARNEEAAAYSSAAALLTHSNCALKRSLNN